MRIGIVLLSLGIGGTEKRLATLFRFLSRQSRHRYYLVAPDRLLRRLKDQGILTDSGLELHRVDCGRLQPVLERMPATFYSAFPAWRQGLDRALLEADTVAKTDVFHYGIPISYFVASARFRRASVIEAMASTLERHIEWMLRAAARRGTVVNCLSAPIFHSLERRLGTSAAEHLRLSPGSLIDFTDMPVPRKKLRQVAFVGRMESIKNPLLFVDAIARLADRTSEFQAVMLGEGRLSAAVNRRILQLGLGNLIDRSFHNTPRQVLADSQVFVSLQSTDNYPSQALLEAMACGCATVASDVGTTRRLVTPDTGVLVPLDPDAIADAIFRLLSMPALAAEMGAAARELVRQDHSVGRYAQYIEDLYQVSVGATPHAVSDRAPDYSARETSQHVGDR